MQTKIVNRKRIYFNKSTIEVYNPKPISRKAVRGLSDGDFVIRCHLPIMASAAAGPSGLISRGSS